jgi:hypothetical protein
MAYEVSKVDVWTRELDDKSGNLAAALKPLADAGVDLVFVIARRRTLVPGKGIVFLGGIKGDKAEKAAAAAGLKRATDMVALRVEGANTPGDCFKVTSQLAQAGLNLRGLSASVIGNRYVQVIAFDNAADADKAANLLKGGK